MKSSRFYLLFLLSIVFLACGEERNPNIVVVHFLNGPPNLHPTNTNNTYTSHVNALCYQQLMVTGGQNGKLIPELSDGQPEFSEDRLRQTFTVRADAKWPDGSPITAKDVLFSYKLMACPLVESGQRATGIDMVESFRIDPDNDRRCTVQFTDFDISNDLFGAMTHVMDPRVFDPENVLEGYSFAELLTADSVQMSEEKLVNWATFFNDPQWGLEIEKMQSGSGPYRVKSWMDQQQIVLVRNEKFWAKGVEDPARLFEQGPDQIIYKFVKDDKAVELQ
ncbi:MAG: ABC transporter substrate-binding protein, partial [Bacteroidota bacterium]